MKKNLFLLSLVCSAIAYGKWNEEVDFDPKNKNFQRATGCTEQELKPIVTYLKSEDIKCSRTWKKEYHIITDLIKKMNLRKGCEVGVAYGGQSIYILTNSPLEILYSVDPYKHFSEKDYDDTMNFPQDYFDVLYFKVKSKLADFGERSVLVRMPSIEAAETFENDSLDFVFIDANHSFEAVTEDLEAWVPKVRLGGLVSGDDYAVFSSTRDAINLFAINNHVKIHVQGNKWWFIKI